MSGAARYLGHYPPRPSAWIGWLGIFVAVTGGWLGLLSPALSVLEAVTFPGFVAFFVFMASMGVAFLRKPAAT